MDGWVGWVGLGWVGAWIYDGKTKMLGGIPVSECCLSCRVNSDEI
jgi:hypothetical protein